MKKYGFKKGDDFFNAMLMIVLCLLLAAFPAACNGDDGDEDATTDTQEDVTDDSADVVEDEAGDPVNENLEEIEWLDGWCEGFWIELTRTQTSVLYVVDRSTTMLDPADGSDPDPDDMGSCQTENYAPAGGIAFTTKWEEYGAAVGANAQAMDGNVNMGLVLVPGPGTVGTGMINPELFCQGTVTTPVLQVDPEPGAGSEVAAVLDDADNFPICNAGLTPVRKALESAANAIEVHEPAPGIILLVLDGAPNCNLASPMCSTEDCADLPDFCNGNNGTVGCLDDTATVADLGDMEENGVKTYVIGLPGSEDFADVLDAMAQAGGTAQSGGTKYFSVTSAEELETALDGIVEDAVSCVFELDDAPPNADDINVAVDGSPLVRGDEDGFEFDEDGNAIELVGQACDDLIAGDISEVKFLYGCEAYE
ncbi:MAG: hypothetical protein ABIJ56_23935 [Pseudomonadota bacterium]